MLANNELDFHTKVELGNAFDQVALSETLTFV
jgi:hypothetical protein